VVHKLINSIWNKEELPDQWKEFIILPVHKKGDKIDCNNHCGISKMLLNILLSRLSPYVDEIICMVFEVANQLRIRFSTLIRYWRKNGNTVRQYINYSQT
jgi:hypothetical protein